MSLFSINPLFPYCISAQPFSMFWLYPDCPSPPAAKPKVTNVTNESCELDWMPSPDDGGSPITLYIVEKCGNDGRWKQAASTSFTHVVISRMKEGVDYRFRVIAKNIFGSSEPSEVSDLVSTQELKADIDYDNLGSAFNVHFPINLFAMLRHWLSMFFACCVIDLQ